MSNQTSTMSSITTTTEQEWTYTFQIFVKQTLPAGQYYIGDLCYALSDEVYQETLGNPKNGPGLYKDTVSGACFLVANTAWEEPAEHKATDGKVFKTDTGNLGICPASLMKKSGEGGHLYTFESPVKCDFRMGQFTFFWDWHQALDIKTE